MSRQDIRTDGWVRIFEVPTFQKHEKGYTIYKVVSRVFPCQCPEACTQVTVWKRFSQFRKLHKEMDSLHSALYLKGTIPGLPDTSYFNRFDIAVLEERRTFIKAMLDFVALHPPLFTSASFAKFFEDGECRAVSDADRLPPPALTPQPRSADSSLASSQTENDTASPSSEAAGRLAGLDPLPPAPATDGPSNLQLLSEPQPDLLCDLHQAPSPPSGDLSLCSDEDGELPDLPTDAGGGGGGGGRAAEGPGTAPLPAALSEKFKLSAGALGVVDGSPADAPAWALPYPPASPDGPALVAGHAPSARWADTTDTAAGPGFPCTLPHAAEVRTPNGAAAEAHSALSLPCPAASPSADPSAGGDGGKAGSGPTPPYPASPASHHQQSPLPTLPAAQHQSSPLPTPSVSQQQPSPPRSPAAADGARAPLEAERKPSVSPQSEEDAGQYLVLAASSICQAQQAESQGLWELAFSRYQDGIGTLINGVQGDPCAERREAVRRKTALYIRRAEQICDLCSQRTAEARQRSRRLSHLCVEGGRRLADYRVVGLAAGHLRVADTGTGRPRLIKVVEKCAASLESPDTTTVLPENVPHMVQLHQLVETDHAYFLVLQYMPHGLLWDAAFGEPSERLCRPSSTSRCDSPATAGGRPAGSETPPRLGSETPPAGPLCLGSETPPSEPATAAGSCCEAAGGQSDAASSSGASSGAATDEDAAGDAMSTSYLQLFEEFAAGARRSGSVSLARNLSCPEPERPPPTPARTVSVPAPVCSAVEGWTELEDAADGRRAAEDAPPADGSADGLVTRALRLISAVDRTLELSARRAGAGAAASPVDGGAGTKAEDGDWAPATAELPDSGAGDSSEAAVRDAGRSAGCGDVAVVRPAADVVDVRQSVAGDFPGTAARDGAVWEEWEVAGPAAAAADESRRPWEEPVGPETAPGDGWWLRGAEPSPTASGRPGPAELPPQPEQEQEQEQERAERVRRWTAQIVTAVDHLHRQGVICRDLSPENVLLTADGGACLTYFCRLRAAGGRSRRRAARRLYAAPELAWPAARPAAATDWWSVGALLYELAGGRPLHERHPAGLLGHTALRLPERLAPACRSLLAELLQPQPELRPDVRQIRRHPYFSGLDWDRI